MEVLPDHVHLFVTSDPTRCVAEMVNRLKGASSRILRQEFPHPVSRMPTLWSRSYYAGTVGHVSESTVKKYIESDKGRLLYRMYTNMHQTEALIIQMSMVFPEDCSSKQ